VRIFTLSLLILFAGCQFNPGGSCKKCNAPPKPVAPIVVPVDPPAPKPKPRRPWECQQAPVGASVGGRISPDGKSEIHIDLPGRFHQKNRGGSDGAGLCVFASLRHTGLWANNTVFASLFRFMWTRPGGGYPSKVDKMIADYCAANGQPKPSYVQIESGDLEVLKAACAAGKMPGVTYSKSPTGRYGGRSISHMVSLVHADDNWFCVLDNNYIGEDQYEWMTPAEFTKTYTSGRKGWAVILLDNGPPPAPRSSAVFQVAPTPVPLRPRNTAPLFGVDDEARAKGRRTPYTVQGRPSTREEVLWLIIGSRSPKRYVVVVGQDAAKRAAAKQVIGAPTWVVVTEYAPTDWQVADYRFVTSGDPTVYVLDAVGNVLHRQDTLDGLATAMRRADPGYDPNNDPDLRNGPVVSSGPGGGLIPSVTLHPVAAGVVGVVVAFLIGLVFFIRVVVPRFIAAIVRDVIARTKESL
jgi:hypothetical protein